MATLRRDDDAMTTTPDRHGHLCRSLGLLECGVCGLWLWLWYVLWRVLWCLSVLPWHAFMSYVCSLYQIT